MTPTYDRAAGRLTERGRDWFRALAKDWMLVLFVLPAIVYYAVFAYAPMYGLVIAFKRFQVMKGIIGSDWVGLLWFQRFLGSAYFVRLLRNTFLISVYGLLWGFPMPILFALCINEIGNARYKKLIQTITYMPHFISTVVIVSILDLFLSPTTGVVNEIVERLTGSTIYFMTSTRWFRTIYIASGIWQGFGWGSIIYLAAMSGIDPCLYEAAAIDGSTRLKNMRYITIPSILPTIATLLILNCGSLLSVGYEKLLLMYNEKTYEVADVISTFTYRRGIVSGDYSYASAVGLFNSVINFVLLVVFNFISKRALEVSLW